MYILLNIRSLIVKNISSTVVMTVWCTRCWKPRDDYKNYWRTCLTYFWHSSEWY